MRFARLVKDRVMGKIRSTRIRIIEDEIVLITFIWSCTKFLAPKTNGLLLSYKSKKAEWLSSVAGISSSCILSW